MVRLTFMETGFMEDKGEGEAYLDLDEENQKAVLSFTPAAGLVKKRMAQRQARSICATGFQLRSGGRLGAGYSLEVQEEAGIGDILLQEGHKYKAPR
ncbi:MAG: hypothetical protein ACXACI_07505 [Candidatus Hodarchaeales archaeon]